MDGWMATIRWLDTEMGLTSWNFLHRSFIHYWEINTSFQLRKILTRQESSMIHSAASPQSRQAMNPRLILQFWDGQADNMCEYSDHYQPGLWSASWIYISYFIYFILWLLYQVKFGNELDFCTVILENVSCKIFLQCLINFRLLTRPRIYCPVKNKCGSIQYGDPELNSLQGQLS